MLERPEGGAGKLEQRGRLLEQHVDLELRGRIQVGLRLLASRFGWLGRSEQEQEPDAVGSTTVLFKRDPFEGFQNLKMSVQRGFVVTTRRLQRGIGCRQNFLNVRFWAVFLQRHTRGFLARRRYRWALKAIAGVPALACRYLARLHSRSMPEQQTRRRPSLFKGVLPRHAGSRRADSRGRGGVGA